MSNNSTYSNVIPIHFGKKETQASGSATQIIAPTAQSVVVTLAQPGVGNIYWERDTGGYSEAVDFFQNLIEKRTVQLLYDPMHNREITHLRVFSTDTSEEHDISVEQFIHLTHLTPHEVSNPQQYTKDWLKKYHISHRRAQESDTIIRVPLQADDLDIYHPDTILAVDTLFSGHYTCQLRSHLGPIGYGELRNFAGNRSMITLLDLMLAAYDDAISNEAPIDQSTMEVAKVEGRDIIYTAIAEEFLDTVIHRAIIRQYPLCQNMTVSKARSYYFHQVTLSRIEGE